MPACPHCQVVTAATEKFCGNCGFRFDAAAGSPNPARAETDGERRQLTVLFCDMVGSTEMAGRLDVEDYHEVLRLYEQAVAASISSFNGHVAQYLGDGVVAYFGWPIAYGDDAERSVRAGLAILEAIENLNRNLRDDRKIAARVGIHTGRVVLGVVGVGPRREIAAFGETPNIAARAQGLASAGSVVITDATSVLLKGGFVTEPLASIPLKGVARPIALYRVLKESTRESGVANEARPFVGRIEELAVLQGLGLRTEKGEGQVVVISGEPGIGKSRLLREFAGRPWNGPHLWLGMFCSPFSINTPFAPVIEGLTRAFLKRRTLSPAEAFTRLERAVTEAGLKTSYALPVIAEMLNLPLPAGLTPMLSSPDQKRKRFIAVLAEWLINIAREQTLVVALEDVQWADPSTLELFQYIAERSGELPMLLICTARTDFTPPWPRWPNQSLIAIARLTRAETVELICAARAGVELPGATVELVAERSGGVPLFVEELSRIVADRQGEAVTDQVIPATLADSLMARLDCLGKAKEVAQIAAVMGRTFSHEMLREIAHRDDQQLNEDLARLVAADLIHVRGTASRLRYIFKHALVRDAAYDSLLRSRRRILHAAVAQALSEKFPKQTELEPETLAYHLTEAGDADAASQAWRTAGERAANRGALVEAAANYARAVDLLVTLAAGDARDQLEMSTQMTLASILSATKGLASPQAEAAYLRASELGSRLHPDRAAALLGLWQMHITRGEGVAAQNLAERRLQIAKAEGTAPALCWSHFAMGATLFHRGQLNGSIHHLRSALERYAEGASPARAFDAGPLAMAYLGVALALAGDCDDARSMSESAVAAAQQLARPPTVAFCQLNAAALHWLLLDAPETRRVATEGAVFARAHGLEQFAAGLEVYAGWATVALGGVSAGITAIRQAIGGWLANGQRIPHAWYLSILAAALAQAGQFAEASEIIDEAAAAVGEMLLEETIVLATRAEIYERKGCPLLEIEAAWHGALTSARGQSAKHYEMQALARLAALRPAAGGVVRMQAN